MNAIEQTIDRQPETANLLSMITPVFRRWKLIIFVTVSSVVATYGLLKTIPSTYKSTTEILIFDPTQQMDEKVTKSISPFVESVDNVAMGTEVEIIKSKALALRVAQELRLDRDPEFQPQSRLSLIAERLGLGRLGLSDDKQSITAPPDEVSAERLDSATDALLQRLQVERVLFSYILSISATSHSPQKAQLIAQTIAGDYLASERQARQDAVARVSNWLKSRVDDLQSRVLETEASIEKLKFENGIKEAGSTDLTEQQIAGLNSQLIALKAEVAGKKVHLDEARHIIKTGGDVPAIPEFMASVPITQLRQQQEVLSWQEAQLRGKLGENHSAVTAIRAQLAGLNKQLSVETDHILANMESSYDIAVQQEQSLQASLDRLTGSEGKAETALKLQQMRRVGDADRKLYESYLSQFNEISQRRMLQDVSARIITPAGLPGSPSSPRRNLFYILGMMFGLGGGCLLALLLEFVQRGVKTSLQVEQSFGLPVVGLIPLVPAGKAKRADYGRMVQSMLNTPLSEFSEAVRAMRLGLQLSHSELPPKVLLVTSAVPGEGKSTAAMLLAASSASSGCRTVLVDCDLRQQLASRVLGGHRQPGLSELLRGTAELMDVIGKESASHTYVIPAGSNVSNPADLLMLPRMRELIAELRSEFDYIVIDTPPLLPVIDALALAAVADKILLVVEWSRTPQACISEAFKVLRPETGRIAGIVLNKVDMKQISGYGYRGYYRYLGKYTNAA